MSWKKVGRIFVPSGKNPLMLSHAILPTPHRVENAVRVYFASCDADMRGRIFFVELDARDPARIVRFQDTPVLDVGTPGSFDADGVNPTCIIEWEDRLYLYYVGYARPASVPYTLLTGVAVSDDGGESFHRISERPLLEAQSDESCFRTASFVRQDGDVWRMWYIGGGEWFAANDRLYPVYALKHLTSGDPLKWSGRPDVLLEPDRAAGEIGFGRPWVESEDHEYSMLISVRRTSGYHLVSAMSGDGIEWSIGPPAIDTGPDVWDSEMVCYGAVFEANGSRYLLYNGNQYGRSGFGMAVEVKQPE